MNTERLIRAAARPLLPKLVPPLEPADLHQEGRIALWQRGHGQPEAAQCLIARRAMIEAIRAARWVGRPSTADSAERMFMTSYDRWDELPDAPDPAPGPLDGLLECERDALLQAELVQLPERPREVLRLALDGALCWREIGLLFGVSGTRAWQIADEAAALVGRRLARA